MHALERWRFRLQQLQQDGLYALPQLRRWWEGRSHQSHDPLFQVMQHSYCSPPLLLAWGRPNFLNHSTGLPPPWLCALTGLASLTCAAMHLAPSSGRPFCVFSIASCVVILATPGPPACPPERAPQARAKRWGWSALPALLFNLQRQEHGGRRLNSFPVPVLSMRMGAGQRVFWAPCLERCRGGLDLPQGFGS